MTKTELNNIIELERWPVKFTDFTDHNFFIIFPIAIIFIGTMAIYSGLKNNVTELTIASLIILVLGIVLLIFITRRLIQNQRFKSCKINGITAEIIQESIQILNLKEFDFKKEIGFFSGLTRISGFSAGERVTIILDGEKLLINSRPIMGPIFPQPITIFKDRKNIKKVINEIENTTANSK